MPLFHRSPDSANWHYVNAAVFGLLALQQALGVLYPTIHRGWTGTPAEVAAEALVCLTLAAVFGRWFYLDRKEVEESIRLRNMDVFTRAASITVVMNILYKLIFKH